MKKNTLPLLILVSILAFIGGCAPTTSSQKVDTTDFYLQLGKNFSGELDPLLFDMTELSDQEKLSAAEAFLAAGNIEDGRTLLGAIQTQNLSNRQFINFTLLAAENFIAQFDRKSADQLLNQPRFKGLFNRQNIELKQRILSLHADVTFAIGDFHRGIDKLTALSRLVKRKTQVRDIHDRIWVALSRMSYSQLNEAKGTSSILSGWLALAASSRRYTGHPDEQYYLLSQWRRNWKSHPAAKIPPSYFSRGKFWDSNPEKIALLLPFQENYYIASNTVIQGFMDAYYQTMNLPSKKPTNLPELIIYDTSTQPILEIYNQAVSDGVDMVIGPMRQSEVEDLILSGDLPIPTLTLNRLDNPDPINTDNLFQFGLSTVDELTQIADRAQGKGFNNILIISPDNNWGHRSATFFTQYWTEQGGTIVENVHYSLSVNDFTKLLKQPLYINLSEQRGLAIKRFINSRVNYAARRRQDIDLVVMLGYPLKARQIKPALDFLYASNIPVMATSHIYNGEEQIGLDRDLSTVEFSSMPWALSGQLSEELKPDTQLHTAFRRLYALGNDSFLISRNLNNIEQSQILPIFGATGLLSYQNGVIFREQKWARFERGKATEIY